jgi:hypothetical protein
MVVLLRRSHGFRLTRDGKVAMAGTNVVRFAADGRICDVTGVP